MKTIQIPVERRQELFDKCAAGTLLSNEELKETILSYVQETREMLEQGSYETSFISHELSKSLSGAHRFFAVWQVELKNLLKAHPIIVKWALFASGATIYGSLSAETADKLQEEVYRKLGVL